MAAKPIPVLLEEIAALLEIKGENPFKVRAYYNAAHVLAGLENLETVVREKRLREIKGIGETLSKKIEEYAVTGRMKYYEELIQEVPASLLDLMQVPNLGPKKIKLLYEQLGITNLGELEYACKENRLISLFRFGEKTQDKILKGVEFLKRHKGEYRLGEIYPLAMQIKERFEKVLQPGYVEVCGSIRRRKEIVRDVDLLVAGKDWAALSSRFISMPEVEEVIAEGETKTSCRLHSGIEADLRVVPEESYACALLHFTGSKEHNVKLRGFAKKKGFKLNEYGLFGNGPAGPFRTEEEVYRFLGLSYMAPEIREDTGEIEAALEGKLPQLVRLEDVKGTFHVHTAESDGSATLEQIADEARKMGLSYVGITDHSKSAYYAGGLREDQVRRQWEAIDRFNAENKGFHFFKGIESDILPDGDLDFDMEVLSGFDFVIGSIHSVFTMKRQEMEKRIIRALENPHMTMLGHPTGRLLLAREGYEVDMRTIIEEAARCHVIIELNASPYRLDIDWRHLKFAREKGVMISINPDAHSLRDLHDIYYGVGIARKGWLEKKDVLNTRSADQIREIFARLKASKG
jgi:DNA polymerase (family 10)